jgi:hypothetical protein
MRDLKKYWREVRVLASDLPPFVWLAPANGAGELVEVKCEVAARLLHAASHRLATEAEMVAHQQGQNAQRRHAFHDDLRKKGIAVVSIAEPVRE